jgi:CRP-like cAMP-binding protein
VKHQLAAVHELARIEMLAGIPGETLGRLAERMVRRELSPGESILESAEERERFWVVIEGMLRSSGGRIVRPGESLNGDTPFSEPLQAMTPAVVASCERAAFEELVRPNLKEAGGS